jgi:hypothetical protein
MTIFDALAGLFWVGVMAASVVVPILILVAIWNYFIWPWALIIGFLYLCQLL